jgi:hypothetical protein
MSSSKINGGQKLNRTEEVARDSATGQPLRLSLGIMALRNY